MRAIYRWSSILALQNSLVAAGYLARTVDGDYGSTTKEAVYLFQKDKGLTATGEADDATRDAIRRAEGAGYRNGGGVVYAEGNRGDVISDMQQRLQEAGSLKGDIDGVYGGDTVKAVKDFQRSRGFPVSGAIDEVTYRALRDISAGTPAPAVSSLSVTGGVNSVTRTKLNEVYVAQTGDYILSEGARGKRVIHLQNQLLLHGYDPGVVDGVFGAGTADAIRMLWTMRLISAASIRRPIT